MGESPNPAIQGRRLRAELRRARLAKRLTQKQVASAMDWSLSKVIRIEKGDVSISTNDLKVLLSLYGIADQGKVDQLLSLAKEAREPSGWRTYHDVASEGLIEYIQNEEAAKAIQCFQPQFVPGLLQTSDYAESVIGRFSATPTLERVEIRMKRQDILWRQKPPKMHFIIDEAALRRVVGGNQVMDAQIRHIITIADMPHVTIEIVPFTAGAYPGMEGPFVILEYSGGVPAALYTEDTGGEMTGRDDQGDVRAYQQAFGNISRLTLGPEKSLQFLSQLASDNGEVGGG